MKILVTGAVGFIGMHVVRRLLDDGEEVVGIDNLNDYYDVHLKEDRLKQLTSSPDFRFIKIDVSDPLTMGSLFAQERFTRVVHLAAQAGVRYSLKNPHAYINSNVVGFLNVLEGCRHNLVEHLVYASSSSVYGANSRLPFSVNDHVDHPVSLYAATKRSNELMAHTYSYLYRLPTTGLRFFTVYGPWGRPDMSPSLFARAITEGRPIEVYNDGKMERDFTYIDDIVEGVVRVLRRTAVANISFDRLNPDPASSDAPYQLFNIGNNQPVQLMAFIDEIERALGKNATIQFLPLQSGDVIATCADIEGLRQAVGFAPSTPLGVGVGRFVAWFQNYYGSQQEHPTSRIIQPA